jgi:hypothetical protein
MTSQEAQERLIEKVIAALAAQRNPRPRRTRMSPSDHYSIAKYARANDDITSWLTERRDVGDLCDPAIEVSYFWICIFAFSLYFLRSLFHDSRTICLLGFAISHMMEMSMTSPTLIAPQFCSQTTRYTTIAFCASTILPTTYDVNRTPSIPALAPSLWFSPTKMRRLTHSGMPV